MDDMLLMRLNLLLSAGEINEQIKDGVIEFGESLERLYTFELTEENSAMLITHLAMALARIKRGMDIDSIDEEIFKEVKESKVYKEMPKLYTSLEKKLNINIPEAEKNYIALHVCTLIENLK